MELIEHILNDRNLTEACREVIRNRGAGGIDSVGVKELEAYLRKNKEKLKTIISSGNYIPQPIRGKEIPKSNGKLEKRLIGVPQGGPISPLLSNIMLHEVNINWW
ncbi:MAG: hypothetical protein ACQER7_13785 [Bacteroidota bacterium]